MYVGNLILIAGLAVASNSLTCVLVSIPLFVFFYIAIVAAEEVFLRGKFQDVYDRYAAEVPRWLPRLGAVAGMVRDNQFHWKRVLVKECATPFGWMTMMIRHLPLAPRRPAALPGDRLGVAGRRLLHFPLHQAVTRHRCGLIPRRAACAHRRPGRHCAGRAGRVR